MTNLITSLNAGHFRRALIACLLWAMGIGLASAQNLIEPGDSINGTANGSNREYSLQARAEDVFIITLQSDDFDAYLTVQNPSGRTLAENDDSGLGLDARLRFVVPADGTYTVIVGAAFSEPPFGDFTLRVSRALPTRTVSIGDDAIIIEPSDGTSAASISFVGVGGQIVSISATSRAGDDLALTLYGPGGEVIAEDDDSGPALDPLLLAQILPTDGTYTVEVYEIYGADLGGSVVAAVTEARLEALDDSERIIQFMPDDPPQIFTFRAIGGITYRLEVRVDTPAHGDFAVTATAADESPMGYLSVNAVSGASMDLVSEKSTDVRILIESFSGQASAYGVRVEPIKK